jgi:hypothetical protein
VKTEFVVLLDGCPVNTIYKTGKEKVIKKFVKLYQVMKKIGYQHVMNAKEERKLVRRIHTEKFIIDYMKD